MLRAFDSHHERFKAILQLYPLCLRKQGWLKSLELLGQLFERVVVHRLAHHFAGRGHAKHHLPAPAVGKIAQGAASRAAVAGQVRERRMP